MIRMATIQSTEHRIISYARNIDILNQEYMYFFLLEPSGEYYSGDQFRVI